MVKLFFSYSHKDETLRNILETHLAILKRQGIISTWHDRRIEAGKNFANEIDENLLDADIILLLISADFLASDYCYDIEMTKALERNDKNEARVIPIILRQCDWKHSNFKSLLALPQDGKPVTLHDNQDSAFFEITTALRDTIDKLGMSKKIENATTMPSYVNPPMKTKARSSNLYIKREFTDHDKITFLNDGFEYIASYFNESLLELKDRNPEITVNFKRIDTNQFIAYIFKHGTEVNKCKIWLTEGAHWGNGIAYTEGNTSYQNNSINDMLTVVATEQLLYFKSDFVNFTTSKEKNTMSPNDASEYFWAHFIERLQR